MITRRDLIVAAVAIAVSAGVQAAVQQSSAPVLGSTVFDWTAMADKPTNVGSVRSVVRQRTATLDELEMHITTLKPGLSSHDPHQHVNEELIIIREGTVETLSNGVWQRTGPGSIIFNASNQLHAIRNVGTAPAVYHVINWKPPAAR
jgi:XRE family transcriptional regulator, regulator of sulfur utilization